MVIMKSKNKSMKFKKRYLLGFLIIPAIFTTSTFLSVAINKEPKTQDDPPMLFNISPSSNYEPEFNKARIKKPKQETSSSNNFISQHTGSKETSYLKEIPHPLTQSKIMSFERRKSKPHYGNQEYGVHFILKSKDRKNSDSDWVEIARGFQKYILLDDDNQYEDNVTWNINRTINLENEFKVVAVFDFTGDYSYDHDDDDETKSRNSTMGSARDFYEFTKTGNSWLEERGAEVGKPTWKAYDSSDNGTFINSWYLKDIFKKSHSKINPDPKFFKNNKIISSHDVYLKSLNFTFKFKGLNIKIKGFLGFDTANNTSALEISGSSDVTATFSNPPSAKSWIGLSKETVTPILPYLFTVLKTSTPKNKVDQNFAYWLSKEKRPKLRIGLNNSLFKAYEEEKEKEKFYMAIDDLKPMAKTKIENWIKSHLVHLQNFDEIKKRLKNNPHYKEKPETPDWAHWLDKTKHIVHGVNIIDWLNQENKHSLLSANGNTTQTYTNYNLLSKWLQNQERITFEYKLINSKEPNKVLSKKLTKKDLIDFAIPLVNTSPYDSSAQIKVEGFTFIWKDNYEQSAGTANQSYTPLKTISSQDLKTNLDFLNDLNNENIEYKIISSASTNYNNQIVHSINEDTLSLLNNKKLNINNNNFSVQKSIKGHKIKSNIKPDIYEEYGKYWIDYNPSTFQYTANYQPNSLDISAGISFWPLSDNSSLSVHYDKDLNVYEGEVKTNQKAYKSFLYDVVIDGEKQRVAFYQTKDWKDYTKNPITYSPDGKLNTQEFRNFFKDINNQDYEYILKTPNSNYNNKKIIEHHENILKFNEELLVVEGVKTDILDFSPWTFSKKPNNYIEKRLSEIGWRKSFKSTAPPPGYIQNITLDEWLKDLKNKDITYSPKDITFILNHPVQMIINPYKSKQDYSGIEYYKNKEFVVEKVVDKGNGSKNDVLFDRSSKKLEYHINHGFGMDRMGRPTQEGWLDEGFHSMEVKLSNYSENSLDIKMFIDLEAPIPKIQASSNLNAQKLYFKYNNKYHRLYTSWKEIGLSIEDYGLLEGTLHCVASNGIWYYMPFNIQTFKTEDSYLQKISKIVDFNALCRFEFSDIAGNEKTFFMWIQKHNDSQTNSLISTINLLESQKDPALAQTDIGYNQVFWINDNDRTFKIKNAISQNINIKKQDENGNWISASPQDYEQTKTSDILPSVGASINYGAETNSLMGDEVGLFLQMPQEYKWHTLSSQKNKSINESTDFFSDFGKSGIRYIFKSKNQSTEWFASDNQIISTLDYKTQTAILSNAKEYSFDQKSNNVWFEKQQLVTSTNPIKTPQTYQSYNLNIKNKGKYKISFETNIYTKDSKGAYNPITKEVFIINDDSYKIDFFHKDKWKVTDYSPSESFTNQGELISYDDTKEKDLPQINLSDSTGSQSIEVLEEFIQNDSLKIERSNLGYNKWFNETKKLYSNNLIHLNQEGRYRLTYIDKMNQKHTKEFLVFSWPNRDLSKYHQKVTIDNNNKSQELFLEFYINKGISSKMEKQKWAIEGEYFPKDIELSDPQKKPKPYKVHEYIGTYYKDIEGFYLSTQTPTHFPKWVKIEDTGLTKTKTITRDDLEKPQTITLKKYKISGSGLAKESDFKDLIDFDFSSSKNKYYLKTEIWDTEDHPLKVNSNQIGATTQLEIRPGITFKKVGLPEILKKDQLKKTSFFSGAYLNLYKLSSLNKKFLIDHDNDNSTPKVPALQDFDLFQHELNAWRKKHGKPLIVFKFPSNENNSSSASSKSNNGKKADVNDESELEKQILEIIGSDDVKEFLNSKKDATGEFQKKSDENNKLKYLNKNKDVALQEGHSIDENTGNIIFNAKNSSASEPTSTNKNTDSNATSLVENQDSTKQKPLSQGVYFGIILGSLVASLGLLFFIMFIIKKRRGLRH